jgi:hypothetical protein
LKLFSNPTSLEKITKNEKNHHYDIICFFIRLHGTGGEQSGGGGQGGGKGRFEAGCFDVFG